MSPSTPVPSTTSDLNLVLELAGACVAMTDEEFAEYATNRVTPLIKDQPEFLLSVVILATTMTGSVIETWGEDTARSPQEILNAIAKRWAHEEGNLE